NWGIVFTAFPLIEVFDWVPSGGNIAAMDTTTMISQLPAFHWPMTPASALTRSSRLIIRPSKWYGRACLYLWYSLASESAERERERERESAEPGSRRRRRNRCKALSLHP